MTDITPVVETPTTFEEWKAHPHCISSVEKAREYVVSRTTSRGVCVPFWQVLNLGQHSILRPSYFNSDNVDDLYTMIFVTEGSPNPDFIGNVHNLRDPRLKPFKLVLLDDKRHPYMVSEHEKDLRFNIGDLDGLFTSATGGVSMLVYRKEEDDENVSFKSEHMHLASYNMSEFGNCNQHLNFNDPDTANEYQNWCKHDISSVARHQRHIEEMSYYDSILDHFEEPYMEGDDGTLDDDGDGSFHHDHDHEMDAHDD